MLRLRAKHPMSRRAYPIDLVELSKSGDPIAGVDSAIDPDDGELRTWMPSSFEDGLYLLWLEGGRDGCDYTITFKVTFASAASNIVTVKLLVTSDLASLPRSDSGVFL